MAHITITSHHITSRQVTSRHVASHHFRAAQIPAAGVLVWSRHHPSLHRLHVRGRDHLAGGRGHHRLGRGDRPHRVPGHGGRGDGAGDDRRPPAGDVLPREEGQVGPLHEGEAPDPRAAARAGGDGNRRVVCSLLERRGEVGGWVGGWVGGLGARIGRRSFPIVLHHAVGPNTSVDGVEDGGLRLRFEERNKSYQEFGETRTAYTAVSRGTMLRNKRPS